MSIEDHEDAESIAFRVEEKDAGARIDQLITDAVEQLSRSAAARLVREGEVSIGGATIRKPAHRVEAGDRVEVVIPSPAPANIVSQDIPLRIIHQDDDLAIVDKPAGLVIHPAAGHASGTLVNALLHHLENLSGVGGELRPGIVHRLDKDTSGLLVVAKNDRAHRILSETWNTDAVRKFYLALVYGAPPESGTIDRPIARHPKDRKKMAIVEGGRRALTEYRTVGSFTGCSLVELELKTGRTHQIRVHLQTIGHPVVGDSVYGGAQWKGVQDRRVRDLLRSVERQALHAARLELIHPTSGERMTFESELPGDMGRVVERLRG
ncbi:MAG: RluA family pseudouridine synthase [Thermoanaerobaculia bacterium]|nr:RluA family pseudouridine synthase [Thermoanaerobaculia bacterium]